MKNPNPSASDLNLDLRGLTCPHPVLSCKRALDNPSISSLQALVDDEINVQNLERLSQSQGCTFSKTTEGDHFIVLMSRTAKSTTGKLKADLPVFVDPKQSAKAAAKSNLQAQTVILISKDRFGEGEPEFSTNLLNMFLQTVLQSGHKPQVILLANTGVKLMAKGSPFLKVLNDFQAAGVEVLACGLCVDFYGLKEDIPLPQITNMFVICEYLFAAQKIICP